MAIKSSILRAVSVLWLFVSVCCSGFGKLDLELGPLKSMNVERLIRDWRGYNISYAAWPADYPVSILFDPKNDSRTLLTDSWIEIKDRDRLLRILDRLESRYNPRLYRILGQDDQFYGYLYSGRNNAYVKVVNRKTLRVYEIYMPSSEELE